MRLLSTKLCKSSALILLGSIASVSLTTIAENFELDEDESEQGYDQDDSAGYDPQPDLQKTSQPAYDEPEDDDESYMDWENDSDESEKDDTYMDNNENMNEY